MPGSINRNTYRGASSIRWVLSPNVEVEMLRRKGVPWRVQIAQGDDALDVGQPYGGNLEERGVG